MNFLFAPFWCTVVQPCVIVLFVVNLLLIANSVNAQSEAVQLTPIFERVNPENQLIPQYLLPCIHAAEVQDDLGLTGEQLEKLEGILRELDRGWWPARILEVSRQRATVYELETELFQKLTSEFPAKVVQRVQQLELQAQWPRSALRPDVAKKAGLSAEVQARFLELAQQTEKKLAELADASKSDPTRDVSTRIADAKKTEQEAAFALLNDTQKQAFQNLIGKQLNLSAMERIYPIAPELIDSNEWAGTTTTLGGLKGKVVLVHFYAFQCINCRNNFGCYNEWAEKFKDQDVAIIGIQTPETSAEFDPALVREAVKEDKLEFPVLIDLKSENWKAWGNTMWPTVYVVDKKGYVRFWWQGELNWQGATGDQKIADVVNKLLKE